MWRKISTTIMVIPPISIILYVRQALTLLNRFIEQSFEYFGTYQDAVLHKESYMFHSILSSSINIGLLNPSDIISSISKIKNKIPINSYEAYVRQLFWREYQRYNYIYNRKKIETSQLFEFKNKLDESWYKGETGIYQ